MLEWRSDERDGLKILNTQITSFHNVTNFYLSHNLNFFATVHLPYVYLSSFEIQQIEFFLLT